MSSRNELADAFVFGKKVYCYDVLESTQTRAKRLAREGVPEGTLVIAETQTKGYGRQGDSWHSAPKGLWFSLVLYPKFSPDQIERFSIAVGKSVQRTLAALYPEISFEVKSPNDVLVRFADGTRKKICGILCETELEGSSLRWLVLGIGLNVANILAQHLKDQAVSLEEICQKPVARMPLLKQILQDLGSSGLLVGSGLAIGQKREIHFGNIDRLQDLTPQGKYN